MTRERALVDLEVLAAASCPCLCLSSLSQPRVAAWGAMHLQLSIRICCL